MPSEAYITTKVRKKFEAEGAWVRKSHGGPSVQGWPDLIGCLDGIFFGVEMKKPGKERTLTDLQKSVLRQIRKAGGVAVVGTGTDVVEEVKRLVRRTKKTQGSA